MGDCLEDGDVFKMQAHSAKQPATVRVAMWSANHRWLVFGLWFIFTIGIFALSLAMGGTKTSSVSSNSGVSKTDSRKAGQVFSAANVTTATVPTQDLYLIVTNPSLKTSDPEYKTAVTKMTEALQAVTYKDGNDTKPAFSRVVNPFVAPPSLGLTSPDNSSVRVIATIQGVSSQREKALAAIKPVTNDLKAQNKSYQILVLNNTILNDEISEIVNTDLDGSLKVTIPLTFIILLIAFGAVAASVVPLILAATALVAAFGLLGIYSQTISEVSAYAGQLVVLIGLAVAVDYSLFLITRFRTERRNGRTKMKAIEVASSTAGRAVFFSGLMVAISLAGLFIIDDPIFRSMAVGTIGVVLISVIGSLTFLPAVLAIFGNGINWGRIPYFGREQAEGGGVWSVIVKTVMGRPAIFAIIVTAILLAAAYPVLHFKLGENDITAFPEKLEGVQAIKVLNEKWPTGTNLKLTVVITQADQAETKAAIDKFRVEALKVKGLSEPMAYIVSSNGKVGQLSFTQAGSENDQLNQDAVTKLRTELVPNNLTNVKGVEAYVSGDAAYILDTVKLYTDAMPLVFAFVLGFSFLLLLVVFHSLVIPIKAIILNLLSTGASYGVLVLVFQDGWFGEQLGIKASGIIEAFVPVFIFTILFGLSMDYHLFILTRIKEAKDKGATSDEAVAKGISITSGTITSAAAIMVVVFSVFVTLQLIIIRQLGLGLAVAVFVDATVIRSILLPATMKLLGDWNWWIPKFLDWLPHVTLESEPKDLVPQESGEKAVASPVN